MFKKSSLACCRREMRLCFAALANRSLPKLLRRLDAVSEPVFRVLKPGLLSTLQDLGRHGYQHLGVSPCGAMDAFALRLANRLVGNRDNSVSLEITLAGAELEVLRDCEVALAGADLGARLDSKPLACWENCSAKSGQLLVFSQRRRGARAYLSVAGGFAAENVLGSGSTDLRNGWGGLQGRRFRRGDELFVQLPGRADSSLWAVRPEVLAEYHNPFLLRVLECPQSELFGIETRQQFLAAEFSIGANSNRMGYRLEGPRPGRSRTRTDFRGDSRREQFRFCRVEKHCS